MVSWCFDPHLPRRRSQTESEAMPKPNTGSDQATLGLIAFFVEPDFLHLWRLLRSFGKGGAE